MAACGLQPGRKNSLEPSASIPSSTNSSTNSEAIEAHSLGENAVVMAKFAAAMMRAINAFQTEAHNFQMRIGTSLFIHENSSSPYH